MQHPPLSWEPPQFNSTLSSSLVVIENREYLLFPLVSRVVPVCHVHVSHPQTKRTTFRPSSSAKLKTKGKFAVSTCALGKINSVESEYEIRFVKDSAGRCRRHFLARLFAFVASYSMEHCHEIKPRYRMNIADSSGGLFVFLLLLQRSYCHCDNYRRYTVCESWVLTSGSEDTRMSITLSPRRLDCGSNWKASQSLSTASRNLCATRYGFISLFNAIHSTRPGRPINFVGCAEYNSITPDDETKEEGAGKFNK